MKVLGAVPATEADRRTYADTAACRLGLVPLRWEVREVERVTLGPSGRRVELSEELVLVFGRPS